MDVTFIGIDLAWSEKNPTGYAVAVGDSAAAELITLERVVMSFEEVADRVLGDSTATTVVAIDAPLVISNDTGMRKCERELSAVFRSAHAGTHSTNREKFKGGGPPLLEQLLAARGFRHGVSLDFDSGGRWMLEVYPHPAFVNLFALDERILYKKGPVAVKRSGLHRVRQLLATLESADPSLAPATRGRELLRSPLDGQPKVLEDKLDAWFCVYLAQHAYRWGRLKNTVFGTESAGYIVVPARSGDSVRLMPDVPMEETVEHQRSRIPGSRGTTTPGYRNRHGQVVIRRTEVRGNDHGQYVYVLRCDKCFNEYGANGSDIFQRRCPGCQGGAAGLRMTE